MYIVFFPIAMQNESECFSGREGDTHFKYTIPSLFEKQDRWPRLF